MPDFLTPQFIASMVVVLLILHMLLGAAAYLILAERRVAAWVQDRIGPNRVGPIGLLQPIADGLKLFFKEEYIPRGVDKALFILAPALTVFPALISFVIIPWAGMLDIATVPFLADWLDWGSLPASERHVLIAGSNANIGIIYLVATASLGVYGVAVGGWASNNKYSFLGGLRASAQMISYEIPLGLSILCIILMAGTIRPDGIVAAQMSSPWFIIHQPIIAIVFFTCMLAEANRTPFDLAEAEAELVGGWHTEYSSMKWALFFMGEYVHLVVGSAFFTVLFLGGWSVNPFGVGPDLMGTGFWTILAQFAVTMGKVFALVMLILVIRWTIPRFRFDQLMRLAWEGMIPLSLLLVLATSLCIFLGWQQYMWLASIACLAIVYAVHPVMPRQQNPNHKIGLIGSRFSPLTEK